MSLKKRLRVIWAALTQTWHLQTCKCGVACWVQGSEAWTDPGECLDCEAKAFEAWQRQYEARQRAEKGAA